MKLTPDEIEGVTQRIAQDAAARVRRAAPWTPRKWRWWGAVLCIVGLGVLAYWNGMNGALVLDDEFNITANRSIRDLSDLKRVLHAPEENFGAAGRPLLNLSFALNYAAAGGTADLRGYHAANIAIHVLAALLLWAITRRTLGQPGLPEWLRAGAAPLALALALLWVAHPLHAHTITYLAQRAEALMALGYLAALYCLIRQAEAPGRRRWTWLAIGSGLAGILVKEPIATATVLLPLFDRAFLAGSWREVWQKRRWLHLGMLSVWVVLLVNFTPNVRGNGFGLGISPWQYLLTETQAICRYVGVMFRPEGMVFDYGTHFAGSVREVWPWLALVSAGGVGAAWAWGRNPRVGFAAVAFYVLLAPTSSFVPFNKMPYAESRLYLPLAVVLAGVLVAAWRVAGRWSVVPALAVLPWLVESSVEHNRLFANPELLWRRDLAAVPDNARVHNNLGLALYAKGQYPEAEAHYREALRLEPGFGMARNNLGVVEEVTGRIDEAMAEYREVRKTAPFYLTPRGNLARLLGQQGKWAEAEGEYKQILLVQPDSGEYQNNMGYVREQLGHADEARALYRKAIALDPKFPPAHNNLGSLFLGEKRYGEAEAEFRAALGLDPEYVDALANLAQMLRATGRKAEALKTYGLALKIDPDRAEIRGEFQGLAMELAMGKD